MRLQAAAERNGQALGTAWAEGSVGWVWAQPGQRAWQAGFGHSLGRAWWSGFVHSLGRVWWSGFVQGNGALFYLYAWHARCHSLVCLACQVPLTCLPVACQVPLTCLPVACQVPGGKGRGRPGPGLCTVASMENLSYDDVNTQRRTPTYTCT